MKTFLAAAALALAVTPASAEPPEPAGPVLQPFQKWVVNFSDTHCTASRVYGSEEEPVTLALRPSVAEDLVRVIIVRPGGSRIDRRYPATVEFLDTRIETAALQFRAGERREEVIWFHLDDVAIERLKLADDVAVELKTQAPLRFALEQMPSVVELLRKCNEDLRAHWNLKGAARVEVAKPAEPRGEPSSWLTDADYPAYALKHGENGKMAFMLLVDEKGEVKDCSLEGSSGSVVLDAKGCVVLLQRAKFKPALDADGNPVRSVYRNKIEWQIPDH